MYRLWLLSWNSKRKSCTTLLVLKLPFCIKKLSYLRKWKKNTESTLCAAGVRQQQCSMISLSGQGDSGAGWLMMLVGGGIGSVALAASRVLGYAESFLGAKLGRRPQQQLMQRQLYTGQYTIIFLRCTWGCLCEEGKSTPPKPIRCCLAHFRLFNPGFLML
jgi:hypothetical protein